MYENLKVAKEADSEAYAASQRKFEAISVGMEINEEGVAETLQEQLIHARSAVAQAKMEHQQATMQMEYCQKELQKKEDAFASSTTDTRDYKVQVAQVQKEIQDLEVRFIFWSKVCDLFFTGGLLFCFCRIIAFVFVFSITFFGATSCVFVFSQKISHLLIFCFCMA